MHRSRRRRRQTIARGVGHEPSSVRRGLGRRAGLGGGERLPCSRRTVRVAADPTHTVGSAQPQHSARPLSCNGRPLLGSAPSDRRGSAPGAGCGLRPGESADGGRCADPFPRWVEMGSSCPSESQSRVTFASADKIGVGARAGWLRDANLGRRPVARAGSDSAAVTLNLGCREHPVACHTRPDTHSAGTLPVLCLFCCTLSAQARGVPNPCVASIC